MSPVTEISMEAAVLPPAPPAASPRRILIVEDDDEVSRALGEILHRFGHEPIHCANAHLAYEVLQSQPINLILADYRMPEMTGLDLIRMIREEGNVTPVIMITGYAATEERLHAENIANFQILKKPVSATELAAALEKSLALSVAA